MRIEVEQNTPEWDALRLGKFTASGFKGIFLLGSQQQPTKKPLKRLCTKD